MWDHKKKKMSEGGMAEGEKPNPYGGSKHEGQAKRPNPYTGNEKEADEMESESEGKGFANGGKVGKKGAVMAIVARLAKKPTEMSKQVQEGAEKESALEHATEGKAGEMEEEGGMEQAKMAAAEELMGAMKSGDKRAFAASLENFMKACSYGE